MSTIGTGDRIPHRPVSETITTNTAEDGQKTSPTEGFEFDHLAPGWNCTSLWDPSSNVYAMGDRCRWFNPRYGEEMRWSTGPNAREHAGIAAHNIGNPPSRRHASTVPFVWSDQHGTRIQHVGDPNLTAVDVDAV